MMADYFDAELDWLATHRRSPHVPSCPVCGAYPHVDWIDVSTPDGRLVRIPSPRPCPNDSDMRCVAARPLPLWVA